ncbi:hypothetical protein [Castellaniella sp.]|uniref:hypothetical protein n=1 Tax=Castellaniella sp. TaxID=1955812 RepID=UPI002AFE4A99|nr:hypothetical protein [Castellaniella sp.]
MPITAIQVEQAIEKDGAWNMLLLLHVALEERAMLMKSGHIAGDKATVRNLSRLGKKLEALMREAEAAGL